MFDVNLPVFYLKPSSTRVKHHRHVFSSRNGSDPELAYTLQTIDPASTTPANKNCYAAALFDAYNPEILFGEVLARPAWTQPTLSVDEIRRNAGVSPPPQPALPSQFVIQLYNPDQQIRVGFREGKWVGSQTYEFSMPVRTFRTPSVSNIDRGQGDPASLPITTKLNFVWRKENKLNRDLTCYMTGRSTDTVERKKLLGGGQRKDPDIAIAFWKGLRELTVYESNVRRLEMEDLKGFEVVLLLGALAIRDVFCSTKDQMREVFNIPDAPGESKLAGGGRKLSIPNPTLRITGPSSSFGQDPTPPPLRITGPSNSFGQDPIPPPLRITGPSSSFGQDPTPPPLRITGPSNSFGQDPTPPPLRITGPSKSFGQDPTPPPLRITGPSNSFGQDHTPPPPYPSRAPSQNGTDEKRNPVPSLQTKPLDQQNNAGSRPLLMPAQPVQGHNDAGTAGLRAEAEAEAQRAAEERHQREQADAAEARRLQRILDEEMETRRKQAEEEEDRKVKELLEAEEREQRRKQAEVEQETERLRRQYGVQMMPSSSSRPRLAFIGSTERLFDPRRHKEKGRMQPFMQTIPQGQLAPLSQQRPGQSNGLYAQHGASASAAVMSGANGHDSTPSRLAGRGKPDVARKRRSFFGLRTMSDDATNMPRLKKKQSGLW